jgi:hypothetical protein
VRGTRSVPLFPFVNDFLLSPSHKAKEVYACEGSNNERVLSKKRGLGSEREVK